MKFRPALIHYAWFERVVMRLLFAAMVYKHIPNSLSHSTISSPNGFARIVDLRFLQDPVVFRFCHYLLWAALVLYVLRLGWAIVLPYLALLSTAVGAINNSHGAISHFLQIVSLVLWAQTAAHFYNIWKRPPNPPGNNYEDRVIFWSQQAILATYLVSALTKLIHTSGMWFIQSPMIAVQIIKTTDQDYYDRLDEASHGSGLAVAEWIVQHPLLVALVLGSGFFLELTAPLALLGRRYALFYGLSLVAFHESVQRIMKLGFE